MAATVEPVPEVPPLIWADSEPDGALLEPPLTRAEITAALLRIADAEGLAAVSVERVATELGTAGPSLGLHIRRPGDLDDLLLDGVFAELVPRGASRGSGGRICARARSSCARPSGAIRGSPG